MAGLALIGILAGMEKAPDAVFDHIPMFRGHEAEARIQARKEAKEKKKGKSSRRTHSAEDYQRSTRRRDDGEHRRRKSQYDDNKRVASRHHDEDGSRSRHDRRRGRERARSADHYDKRDSHRDEGEDSGYDDYYEPRSRRPGRQPTAYGAPAVSKPSGTHRGPMLGHDGYGHGYGHGYGNGYAAPPPPMTAAAGVAAADTYQDNQARRGSGPTPAYVPYAHLYNSNGNTQDPHKIASDSRSSPTHASPMHRASPYTEAPQKGPIGSRAVRHSRGGYDGHGSSEDSYDSVDYARDRRSLRALAHSRTG